MAVKRTKVDTSVEKAILTGMIMSDKFLRDIIPIYSPDFFEISYGPVVAGWCLKHYEKYQVAPKELIQELFDGWCKQKQDEAQIKFVDGFLSTLSDEYEHSEKVNVPYLMDKSIAHFKNRSLQLLNEDIKYCLDNNDPEGAEATLSEFRRIEKITSTGIDVLDDEAAMRSAFDDTAEPLFKLQGKLGDLINTHLVRDSLVGLMGIAKIGKTWNLTLLAHEAVKARCNVAMFQVGDLSQSQMMIRNAVYITKRSNKAKHCKELYIPILDCELSQNDTCQLRCRTSKFGCMEMDSDEPLSFEEAVGYTPCTACMGKPKSMFKGAVWHEKRRPVRPLSWQEAFAAAQDYKKKYRAKRYKLSTHTSRSISVAGIIAQLEAWERLEGWIPDVVIVDYADILAPERKGNSEGRDDTNENWMALRGMSQSKHCCVITVTQANGGAIKEKSVTREHYSTDRRKYDHVTAMFSLSQTPSEKKKGVVRWGTILLREDEWDENYYVNVLGCLSIGRPYLDSY